MQHAQLRFGCACCNATAVRAAQRNGQAKTAGTGSLVIGLPTVAVGIFRYAKRGAYRDRAPFAETIIPMGAGSIIGAVIGGLLVGSVPAEFLKVALGAILLWSSTKLWKHKKTT